MIMDDDDPERIDWEAVVLDRLRERLTHVGDDARVHAGWEAAAVERLRAHFEDEED